MTNITTSDIVDKISAKLDKKIKDNNWMKEYANKNRLSRQKIISDIISELGNGVVKAMNNNEDTIHIPAFGRFHIVTWRKIYSDFKKDNPTLTKEELIIKTDECFKAKR